MSVRTFSLQGFNGTSRAVKVGAAISDVVACRNNKVPGMHHGDDVDPGLDTLVCSISIFVTAV